MHLCLSMNVCVCVCVCVSWGKNMGSWKRSRCCLRGQRGPREVRGWDPSEVRNLAMGNAVTLQNRKSTKIVKMIWIKAAVWEIFWMPFYFGYCIYCEMIFQRECSLHSSPCVYLHMLVVTAGCIMLSSHLIHSCFSFFSLYAVWLFHVDMENRMRFRPLCVSLIGFGFTWSLSARTGPLDFCFLHLHNMCFHLGFALPICERH